MVPKRPGNGRGHLDPLQLKNIRFGMQGDEGRLRVGAVICEVGAISPCMPLVATASAPRSRWWFKRLSKKRAALIAARRNVLLEQRSAELPGCAASS